MALSNKPEEWCRARGLYKTVRMSKITLYKLECLFDIDLNSKDMRRNQLVTLKPNYVNKVVDAMKGINPLRLLSVRGFGRKTVEQVEDLLMHHYIYNKD
tara:strand:+ start:764 stop:1060 length:297 start_codon:yes stop_codon:yes gene_type:complete